MGAREAVLGGITGGTPTPYLLRVSLRWMELDETGDLNKSAAISANTKVKTGEVLHYLLKIDQQMKGRLVNGKMFILC